MERYSFHTFAATNLTVGRYTDEEMSEEIERLHKKNFELARALAAAQRKIAERDELIRQQHETQQAWLLEAHQNLAELASAWIDAQEAWAWHKAS